MVGKLSETVEMSVSLPMSLDTRIYIRMSTQAKAITLSLTTAAQDEMAAAKPMGSFVYALPDVCHSPLRTVHPRYGRDQVGKD
jgi:hypothetical protein